MTYRLLIGQRSYSSWSLRGYLSFALFDIPVMVEDTVIYSPEFTNQVKAFGGNTTVPAVATDHGILLHDSLSIAWHLADNFADKDVLPKIPSQRAKAQNLIAQMHCGYTALRSDCPMNLQTAWDGFKPSEGVLADLSQLETHLGAALSESNGPFLFGEPTLADAFYAPVALRIAGYGLPVSPVLRGYVNEILRLQTVMNWRAEGIKKDAEISFYDKAPLKRRPFPNQI